MTFSRYPKYRPSGVEWLGQVPAEWVTCPLKRAFRVIRGSTPNTHATEFWDGAIPWVTPADLSRLRSLYIEDSQRKITLAGMKSGGVTLVPKGSVMLSTRAPIGLVAVSGIELCTSQGCRSLVPLREVDATYFAYLLSACSAELNIRGKGTTFLELSGRELAEFKVPVPPKMEQTRIAHFLDRETSKIDALVETQRQLMVLLKEKRQAAISHSVTQGLNPKAPMKDSGVESLGKIPAHWEVGRMTKYLDSVVDYRGRTPEKVDEGVLLLTARNIRDGKIDYAASEELIAPDDCEELMRRGRPNRGDVLFTTEAPVGQAANVDRTDVALAQRVIKFRGRANILSNYFLKYWILGAFCQADIARLATGSTVLGITRNKIGQLRLCLPPYDEQKSIAVFLDRQIDKLDSLTCEINRVIEGKASHHLWSCEVSAS